MTPHCLFVDLTYKDRTLHQKGFVMCLNKKTSIDAQLQQTYCIL